MQDNLDLDRYPLDRPASEDWQALIDRCKSDLANDGMFNLPGFLKPDIARATAETLLPRFETDSFNHKRSHNIYFTGPISDLPPDHPAQTRVETSNNTLCGDQIPARPLLELYEWPEFHRFLAAAMNLPALYPMDDDLAGVNVMQYNEGQALNWHFDRSEYTITLLLQSPDQGGVFEYRTGLRSQRDPNYDGVADLMAGKDPHVRQVELSPGTLNVFRGKNTAHRVTPVKGDKARVMTVLCYYETPGVRFTDDERIGFYGRAS